MHLITHQEECLFGDVLGELKHLNPSGHIAADEWQQIAAAHQRDIELDLWTVLPNGIRALIAVSNSDAKPASIYRLRNRMPLNPVPSHHLWPDSKPLRLNGLTLLRGIPGAPVWQRGYQEQRIDDL